MKPLRYLVLKHAPRQAPLGSVVLHRDVRDDDFGNIPLSDANEGSPHGPFERLELEERRLSAEDARELARDENTIRIIPAMPMRLLKPVSRKAPPKVLGQPWGIQAIGADKTAFDGDGVVIAVLDTGIDSKHPAFKGVELVQKNFTPDKVDDDEDGHGTHCAGTIFGRDVDGRRIGVARGVKKALIAKVIGQDGGDAIEIVRAIQWAVDLGANVISMSLGFDPVGLIDDLEKEGMSRPAAFSVAMQGVIETKELFDSVARAAIASRKGVVFVVAAGNESERPELTIAATAPAGGRKDFITVGAIGDGKRYALATFSNTGVDVVAPGVDIVSAWLGGEFMSQEGTSMATPHVAGVAALWIQKELAEGRDLRSDLLRSQIQGSAKRERLPANSNVDDIGIGLVQAP